jgi:hypothetical protein
MVAEFATIVGLIGLYKQERSAPNKQEHQDFIEWLEYHRHEDLKNLIVNNAALLTEVNHLIKADTELILSKIEDISVTLAKVAADIEEFRGLAGLMTHEPDLEPQTRELLRQLVQGGWKKFGVFPIRGRTEIMMIHDGCQPIKTDSQYWTMISTI